MPRSNILTAISSGPARGYIEGLEHRLRETESLLLQMLPVVPENYLEAVTTDLKGSPARNTTTPRRPILNNKTNVEHWKQFPLDSIENIRRWQQDCSERGSPNLSSGQSSPERLPQTTLQVDTIGAVDQRLSHFQQLIAPSAEVLMSTEDPSTQNMQDWLRVNKSGMFVAETAPSDLDLAKWNQMRDMNRQGRLLQDSSNGYSGQFTPDRSANSSAASFYPTDFQRVHYLTGIRDMDMICSAELGLERSTWTYPAPLNQSGFSTLQI